MNVGSETLPRRAGPIPHIRRRSNLPARVDQGAAMCQLVDIHCLSIRTAAARCGLPAVTAWRRYWWYQDLFLIPARWGRPMSPLTTPQRGTRACPNRRPHIPAVDEPRRSKTFTIEIRATGEQIPACDCGALLWSTGALGRRWGVTAERARQLSHRPGFPAVVAVDGTRRLFCSADMTRWERGHRQPRDERGRFCPIPAKETA